VSDWTSCADRLPDDDLTVLFYAPKLITEPVWLGYLDDEEWRTMEGDSIEGVTHWRPVPAPPD